MDKKTDKQIIDIQDESNFSEVSNENNQNGVCLQYNPQTMTLAKRKPPAASTTLASAVVRKPIKLQNFVTGEVTVDTLYQKSVKQQLCSDAICYGALMKQSKDFFSTNSAENSANKERIFSEACDFFEQYFSNLEKNGANSKAHLERLEKVKAEIEASGTYLHQYDELIFGSKLAWRNAARCIGRIQWNKLQVFDARHCTTATELFEAICGHIKFATNNGNLRSAITIFPQRLHGREDYRVWNFQLISYAGYETDETKVITTKEGKSCPAVRGDPANIEFTKICQKLGWKGTGSNWDILPIVVSVPGEDPQMFSLPEELILRVPLVHPKLDFFERLSLQWYALPAVSNMKFEVGGVEFPACPFSGWYMSTEIAVRDLADKQRLNILPTIAREMGLDTASNVSLWKDRAILEINTAVLYSFQRANVTIVDHYTAAESFMKHLENEKRLRGGCPADWVWIIPPISGALTPVFHQEMINYDLKPAFLYQEVPWKVHNWKGVNPLEDGRKDDQVKLSFHMAALVVQFMAGLYARALSTRPRCTILFATETGKSESFAIRLGSLFSSAFNVSVLAMNAYEPVSRLQSEQLLLLVTSTFGNGDAPENGETFWKYLNALKSSNGNGEQQQFSGAYAVFALGSNAYPHFCAFGRRLDDLLEVLGGKRVTDCGTGDELAGQETSFQEWANGAFRAACQQFELKMVDADALPQMMKQAKWTPSSVRLETVPQEAVSETDEATERSARVVSTLGRLAHNKTIINWRLSAREYLGDTENLYTTTTTSDQDPKTIKVVLSSAHSTPIDYKPGDHLAVYPQNDPKTVSAIISKLSAGKANFDATQKMLIKTTVDGGQHWTVHHKLNRPVSLREALVRYLDICSPPTKHLLLLLADTEGLIETDKERLLQLATKTKEYERWKSEKSPGLLYLLEIECPSLVPPLELILTQLPALQPRYYSISSSPLSLPNAIVLTVSVVCYKTADGAVHNGVCSHFLHSIPAGRNVYGFIRAAPSFHLPSNPSVPMIWIGFGTGIAPFRAFWEQRHAEKKNASKNVQLGTVKFFFGCRNAKTQLYRRDIVSMIAQGIISDYYVAFSRKNGKPKKYVQHLLQNKAVAKEIAKMVFQQGGHIYVCGDVSMAADVETVMAKILVQYADGDGQIIEKLKESNRYHEDIFGVTKSAKTIEPIEDVVGPVKEVSEAPLEFASVVKEDNYIPITNVSFCRKRKLMVSTFWRPFW